MYAVKPKMHGPDEVRFTDDLFAAVEDLLGLGRGTIKLGIMDEERRTSANLKACIHAARGRVAFINTGFLDRTGDELHTSMLGGADDPQGRHEVDRVDQGLRGPERRHRARVRPARAGPRSARACGRCRTRWPRCSSRRSATRRPGRRVPGCPSPTAATLHALHYHQVDVAARQQELLADQKQGGRRTTIEELLTVPLADPPVVERRGQDRGDREQPAGHPRLREALGRRRRRLLEGARHPRHRADGGPRHLPDLLPARGQLAAPRHRHRRRGRGGVPPDGRRGRRAAGGPTATGRWARRTTARRSARRTTWSSRGSPSPRATPSRSCTAVVEP